MEDTYDYDAWPMRDVGGIPEITTADCRDFAVEVSIQPGVLEGEKTKIQIKSVKRTLKTIAKEEGTRGVLKEILRTPLFDNCMCMIVVANAVCIAAEQARRLQDKDISAFELLETIFLIVYSAELCLNFYALRWDCFRSNWIRFDLLLVLTGHFSFLAQHLFGGDPDNPLMKLLVLRMVRLLRLARLARTVRLVIKFQELWMLARGLLNSISTAFHTLVFGLVLLFVVGCVTVELIPLSLMEEGSTKDNAQIRDIIETNFCNLPTTMLTLVQFITFDNVVYIYKPLIEEDASLAFFFIIVLLLVGVVFMNLVTAIIVNSGLEQSVQDRNMRKVMMEEKRRRLLHDLEAAFHRIDTNNSGTICRKELSDIDKESLAVLEGYLGVENLPSMFDVLDVDGSGEIAIDEFCDGITSIVLTETQPEIKRIERLAETVHRSLKRCETQQVELRTSLTDCFTSIEAVHKRLGGMCYPGSCNSDSTATTTETEEKGPAFVVADECSKMPDWANTFLTELKETCAKDIHQAMNEACTSIMAQVTDAQPNGEADCCQSFDEAPRFSSPDADPQYVWEVLPPEAEAYLTTEQSRPAPLPRSLQVPVMLHPLELVKTNTNEALPPDQVWQSRQVRGPEAVVPMARETLSLRPPGAWGSPHADASAWACRYAAL